MKIKKIIDLCKKNHQLILYNSGGEQWISDGIAIYPLFDLPRFSFETIRKTYDITDKQAEKIVFRKADELPAYLCFDDIVKEENEVRRGAMYLSDGGKGVIPYVISTGGTAFIDSIHLAPFDDVPSSNLSICERYTDSGELYFVVKIGFLLAAVIMPAKVINEDFVKRLKTLAQQCEVTLLSERSKTQIPPQAEQTSMLATDTQ